MSALSRSIKLSWLALFQPQILWRLLIPLLLSFFVGITSVIAIWMLITNSQTALWFKKIEMLAWFFKFYETTFGNFFFSTMFILFLTVTFFLILYIFIILLTSILIVPLLSTVIHKLYFPDISKSSDLSFLGSLWNTLKAIVVFLTAFVICSPLLLIPGMQIILPLLLNIFLVRKLLLYDVMQGYATQDEFKKISALHKGDLWKLSFLGGIYLFIPFINLLAPALIALGFLFYGFTQLRLHRQAQIIN
jgi:CysZ protein